MEPILQTELDLAVPALHEKNANGSRRRMNGENNRLSPEDRAAHDWYRFILSFPPHLVRDYLQRFNIHSGQCVLDPFCGTGTTLVECKKLGIPSTGIEANPMACFASRVKVDWSVDPESLRQHAERVAAEAQRKLDDAGISEDPLLCYERREGYTLQSLNPDVMKLLITGSISPLPLHKFLCLYDGLCEQRDSCYHDHELLALAKAIVADCSNLQFGPEVGVGPQKPDAPVISSWLRRVAVMADDLHALRNRADVPAVVHLADARGVLEELKPGSIDAVITSPPYPNEKDYTRTTRLESVLLGFITSKADLRALKNSLVRSNTRGVYKADDDDRLVADNPEVQRIADEIEARRINLGKTSGFERLYARVTRLYFGGMARHLIQLKTVLRPGAYLAYVVGDQASYLRVMIRTGQILAEIGQSLGYELVGIDLFRTRMATATKEQLREEVVVLRWPG